MVIKIGQLQSEINTSEIHEEIEVVDSVADSTASGVKDALILTLMMTELILDTYRHCILPSEVVLVFNLYLPRRLTAAFYTYTVFCLVYLRGSS